MNGNIHSVGEIVSKAEIPVNNKNIKVIPKSLTLHYFPSNVNPYWVL